MGLLSSIGHMDAYRCGDDLDDYVERLEQYFIANEIGSLAVSGDDTAEARETAQRKKVATFSNVGWTGSVQTVEKLVKPSNSGKQNFPGIN